ncbi:MAG TPA: metalloregulator ArsR/SmtB family transcription factor [Vicinamibacterales bacterium]|jgi:ArsR family transcriptional regulator|nr:metalloregulator ArsR/SmtB family transcription factor [Vicinamibacterales bacterium]
MTVARPPAILDHLSALADTTRSRILLLLDRHELAVSELCGIMQLPQSTVSRHLKALADSGWIAARAEGTSNVYGMTRDGLDTSARRLWALVREQVGTTPAAAHDQRRVQTVLAERRTKSQEFFSSSAGQWDRLRDDLFGERVHLAALPAFAGAEWTMGDLGCGTGQMTAALAPFVRHVIAVDGSAAMLQAAKKRLQGFDNVELRRGDLEALPIDDAKLDAATLALVLHHLADPRRVLAEVARVLKPGGQLLVVDMLPHDRESYRQQMGHVWLGFSEEHVRRILDESGLGNVRIVPLSPDPKSKGPGLFVATARKTVPVVA